MKKYIEIRALDTGRESTVDAMAECVDEWERIRLGSKIDTKHYTASLEEYGGHALCVRFIPKDEEERKAHPYYEVVVPIIDIIRGAGEQCRHRFFTEKHKP
jgi:hypothetical protein